MSVSSKFILLVATFLSSGLVKAQKDVPLDFIVAVVGDRIILDSEIRKQIKQAEKEGTEAGPDAYCTVLEEMLFQKLLIYQAQIDSIEVTDAEVENDLNQRVNYIIQQGGGSREEFEKFYGKTVEQMKDEYRDATRDRLLATRMQQSITKDIDITPRDIKEFYDNIPQDSLPFMGSRVEYAQIAIVPEITEAEKADMKKKLGKIRKEIMNGEISFCSAASFYSCDPGTRSNCGEFEFVEKGTFVPQFDAMAFSLMEGEVSEIFETQFGYHILQLLERRGTMYRGRHILICFQPSEKNLQIASQRLDSVYTQIMKGTITFEEAVKKFSNDASRQNNGKVMNDYTGDSRFDVRDLDKQTFIVIDPLLPNEITRPAIFQTFDNQQGVRIVKLLTRTEPHRASLEKDYPDISNAALADKKSKAVLKWIKSKSKSIHIKVNDEYKNCRFEYPWIQSGN